MAHSIDYLHNSHRTAGPERLLVVDDEPEFATFIKLVADEMGFTVRTICSTCRFEEMLEQWQPSIITLDMVMPGRDGLDLLQVLSQRGFPGQIVIISGMDPIHLRMAATIAAVKKLRLAATVTKPLQRPLLRDVFHTLRQTA